MDIDSFNIPLNTHEQSIPIKDGTSESYLRLSLCSLHTELTAKILFLRKWVSLLPYGNSVKEKGELTYVLMYVDYVELASNKLWYFLISLFLCLNNEPATVEYTT